MAVLGKLVMSATLDYDKVVKGTKKINSSMVGMEKKVSAFGSKMKAAFSVAAVVGFGAAVKKTFDNLDRIGKVSDKLGIAAEELQKLRFAGEQTGVSVATMDDSLEKFTKRLGQAQAGTGPMVRVLDDLGIKLQNADGSMRSASDVMLDYGDAIGEAETSTQKMYLATEAFGRSGGALVNTFADGSDGVRAYGDQLERAGGVIDGSLIKGAEKANDAINLMSKSLGAINTTVLASLAPMIESVAEAITELSVAMRESFPTIKEWVAVAGYGLSETLKWVKRDLSLFVDAVTGSSEEVANAFSGMGVDDLNEMLDVSQARLNDLRAAMIGIVEDANGMHDIQKFKMLEDSLEAEKAYFIEVEWALNAAKKATREVRKEKEGLTVVITESSKVLGTETKNWALYGKSLEGLELAKVTRDFKENEKWMVANGFALEDISADLVTMSEKLASGKISWDQYAEAMGFVPEKVVEVEKSLFNMEEALLSVQGSIQDSFGSLFENILSGKGIDSFKDFAKEVLNIFKKLVAEMAAAWVTSKIFGGKFDLGESGLASSIGKMFGGGGGIGKFINGGGIGGGVGGGMGGLGGIGGGLGKLGTSISKSLMNGFKGLKGLFSGGGSYAPVGGMAGSGGGAGFSMAGAAIPLAIGAFGMARFAKNAQQKQDANAQYQGMGGGVNEAINQVSAFKGQLNGGEVGEFFITLNEGWTSTIQSLKEANLITAAQGALYDENGNQLIKMTGNVNKVKEALAGAAITGHSLKSSFAEANSSSGEMKISVVGDFEAIKTSIQAAGAIGVGTFKDIQQTANGASLSVQGDLRKWKTYLDGAIGVAISNMNSGLGGTVNQADALTHAFQNAAAAARSIPSTGGDSSSMRGFASGGISNRAAIFGEAGPEAAVPLPDGRTIPVTISGGGSDNTETNMLLKKLIRATERASLATAGYSRK